MPGQLQPSEDARKNIIKKITEEIYRGKKSIKNVIDFEDSFASKQRYAQTYDLLDKIIRGWGNAFAYSNVTTTTMNDLDKKITEEILEFMSWYHAKLKKSDWKMKRRAMGVCLLTDIEMKKLEELPFRINKHPNYHQKSKNMIIVSTDGSVINLGGEDKSEIGPGGWAVVFHGDQSNISGSIENVTNNQMELKAVIEALKSTKKNARIKIRTDSHYVYKPIEKQTVIRSNHRLWHEYIDLASVRRVDFEWIKGHSGDTYNELADKLANEQANNLYNSLK